MDFDPDEVRHALATLPCRNCGAQAAKATLEQDGPHFARIECEACGAWIDWLSWPLQRASERKRRRQRITRLGEDRCEICLRTQAELPPPDTVNEHHVIAHADSGASDPDNTRVYCTACHRLVEWARTYFGHYHPA